MRLFLMIILICTIVCVTGSWDVRTFRDFLRLVLAMNPADWPERRFLQLFKDYPQSELDKYDETIRKHKTFTDFDDVMADLKKVDSPIFAKFEPIYEELYKNYMKMPTEARKWIKDFFVRYCWACMVAGIPNFESDSLNKIKAEFQASFGGLPQKQKEDIQASFPLTYKLYKDERFAW